MVRSIVVCLALGAQGFAPAELRGRGRVALRSTVDIDSLPSLFEVPGSPDEAEFYESLEEALAAANGRKGRSVDGPWDAAFWQEYDEAAWVAKAKEAEGAAAAARLSHYLTAHRIISLSTMNRNRTEFVSRFAPSSLAETEGGERRVAALHCYAGLEAKPTWDAPAWVAGVRAAAEALASGGELGEAALGRALAALRAGEAGGEDDDAEDRGQYLRADQFFEEEFGTDFSDNFGELDESPMRMPEGDDGASLAASLEALDDAFGDEGDGAAAPAPPPPPSSVYIETGYGAAKEAAAPAPNPEAHGRLAAAVHAHFRATDLGKASFAETLAALDGCPVGPRHVSVMAQKPGTRTPSHSELQNHVLTLYVALHGDNAGVDVAGAQTSVLAPGDALVLDSTFKHATFNDGASDAHWLVLDFWHPDLTPTEVDALTAFHKLDEQFILRRSQAADVVDALLNTDRPLAFLQ